jgi:inhibitor of cysteine peptidase
MNRSHPCTGLTRLVLLSALLIACPSPDPKEPPPKREPEGPVTRPDSRGAPPAKTADAAKSLSLSRYASCDELQDAVHRALLYKKKDDDKHLAAQRRVAAEQVSRRVPTPTGRATTTSAAPPSTPQAPQAAPSGDKSASAAPRPSKELEQFTNIQEVGVDEPDHVKIGPDNIYVLRGLEIQVASRTSLQHLGSVQLEDITRAKKLLITAEHLFVLGELEQQVCGGRPTRQGTGPQPERPARRGLGSLWRLLVPEAHALPGSPIMRGPRQPPPLPGKPVCIKRSDTVVQAFRLARNGPPEHVRSWRFKGGYVDARMTGGRVVLIFQQQLNLVAQVRAVLDSPDTFLGEIPKRPIELDANNPATLLSCSSIFRSDLSDQDYRLTKVVAINASQLADTPRQAGFVGGGDQIYMSTENLYLAKIGKHWLPRETAGRERERRDSLVITQIGFFPQNGDITVLAQTDSEVKGRPKDQWAFKELQHQGTSLLGVFTTTGKLWSPDPADVPNNYLFILKRSGSELTVAARLADIARGETIRSLRYIGQWAYAVTFKRTDPLFAIDLSDPLAPKIVGELKIPGFSTYLHPVGDGLLIGIGFDVHEDEASRGKDSVKFQGIKLSLFDIRNPRDLRELDTMIFGGRGSYSDVTGDHHAFFYDPQLRRLAFPLTLLESTSKTEEWGTKRRRINFAGAVLVELSGDKLSEKARWRHNRWIPKQCYEEMRTGRWWEAQTESQDINRIYRIGRKYLTVSRYGLKTYPVGTPRQTSQQLHFPGDFAECGVLRDDKAGGINR